MSRGSVFNRTRRTILADRLDIADSHWSRFRGLMGADPATFRAGQGLWIVPSRGVHTLAMRFPIDVLYLDRARSVVHLESNLKPWRIAPLRLEASSVLELPENTIRTSGTRVGDQIEISLAGS